MAAYHGVLLNDVLPAWKGRKLDSIKRADVKLLLAGIRVDRPVHANRTLAVIKRLYSWALDSEIVENSPAIKLDAPHGPYIRMLALTLQRRSEVAGMRWDELDLVDGVWTIPSNRTKNKVEHMLPLP